MSMAGKKGVSKTASSETAALSCYETPLWLVERIREAENMDAIPDGVAQTCVTSPPYWALRDYGVDGQIGLEDTPAAYVERMVLVMREVRRILRDDGTLWLNIGDTRFGDSPIRKSASEAFSKTWDPSQTRSRGGLRRSAASIDGLKRRDLVGIPFMLATALRSDGWHWNADVIWSKPNPMPAGRITKRPLPAHEHLLMFSKGEDYYSDPSIVVPDVLTIATSTYKGAHFATMPEALAEFCIKATSKPDDIVLEPFAGAGTTFVVAKRLGRYPTGYELKPEYCELVRERMGLWGAA